MAQAASEPNSPQHAITDLYDEERHTFLIKYSPGVIIGMGLTGAVAFFLSGIFGFPQLIYNTAVKGCERGCILSLPPNGIDSWFQQPWPLFFWLCGLMIMLQMSIFRARQLRRQRNWQVLTSLIMISLVAIYTFNPDIFKVINDAVRRIFNIPNLTEFTAFLVNFGIILVFWVDSIRRWILKSQGRDIVPRVDLGIRSTRVNNGADEETSPELGELVAGDFLAGGVLTIALSIVFQPNILGALNGGTAVNCTFLPCPSSDINQSLVYFFLGLLMLAFLAVLGGLAALQPNPEKLSSQPGAVDTSASESAGEGVIQVIITTLLGILQRQWRNLLRNLSLALRGATWPFLILAAVVSFAQVAVYTRKALFLNSCIHMTNPAHEIGCTSQAMHLIVPKSFFLFGTDISIFYTQTSYAVIALALAFAGALSTVSSAGLLIYRWRVAENTMRFIGLASLIGLLTAWLFSLSLTAFNALISQPYLLITERRPFYSIGVVVISFGALVVFGLSMAFNRSRRNSGVPLFVPTVGPRTAASIKRRNEQTGETPALASQAPADTSTTPQP